MTENTDRNDSAIEKTEVLLVSSKSQDLSWRWARGYSNASRTYFTFQIDKRTNKEGIRVRTDELRLKHRARIVTDTDDAAINDKFMCKTRQHCCGWVFLRKLKR